MDAEPGVGVVHGDQLQGCGLLAAGTHDDREVTGVQVVNTLAGRGRDDHLDRVLFADIRRFVGPADGQAVRADLDDHVRAGDSGEYEGEDSAGAERDDD